MDAKYSNTNKKRWCFVDEVLTMIDKAETEYEYEVIYCGF